MVEYPPLSGRELTGYHNELLRKINPIHIIFLLASNPYSIKNLYALLNNAGAIHMAKQQFKEQL